MTRRERTLRKIKKLEMRAIRAAMRANNAKDPLSWAAHRAGERASALWLQARLMLSALKDREAAAARERSKKKLPKQWWRAK